MTLAVLMLAAGAAPFSAPVGAVEIAAAGSVETTGTGSLVKSNDNGEFSDNSSGATLNEAGLGSAAVSPLGLRAQSASAVKLLETGDGFATLSEGIAAAESAGYTSFTLEVSNDVAETKSVTITSNVTIVGVSGAHTVTLPSASSLKVQNGGALVLGDGDAADLLTITSPGTAVSVTSGSVRLNDGVQLSGYDTLSLRGAAATGTITGGIVVGGNIALSLAGQATIDEISGGSFTGVIDALHLTDAGTRIARISGGSFHQTSLTTALHGHAVFVQNESRIDEISGGRFEAVLNRALVVIRGAWVGEISGGEFVANRVGTLAAEDRNATVWVEGDTTITGIGTISGGSFSGAYFGLLLIERNTPVRVDTISGGTFTGVVALQSDRGSSVGEISGGTFTGNQGILNVGVITTIGGAAEITGSSSYGIFNYTGGRIDEITGDATITGKNYAVMNSGAIKLISGATCVGGWSAINCNGFNKGTLETITGGVFWGKNGVAIDLSSQLVLEPGLDASRGQGRYWGKDGVIFSDESLVRYPVNMAKDSSYFMSEETAPVSGIDADGFRYLRLQDIEDEDEPAEPAQPQQQSQDTTQPATPGAPTQPATPGAPTQPATPDTKSQLPTLGALPAAFKATGMLPGTGDTGALLLPAIATLGIVLAGAILTRRRRT
ncbi:MAG: LPXTG cell wall anchor domain-containing protein [Actinomycetia bacterium]|nr:LPXTG cell wall anchor domain-containing protein [Actinomycetes bacterium]